MYEPSGTAELTNPGQPEIVAAAILALINPGLQEIVAAATRASISPALLETAGSEAQPGRRGSPVTLALTSLVGRETVDKQFEVGPASCALLR